jgi:type III secretion system chaperone SycN
MMPGSNHAAIAEFGHNLGMPGLNWSDSGVIVLDFAIRGTLFLEDHDDALLMYLVRTIDSAADRLSVLQTALQLCHYRERLPYPVQPGLSTDAKLTFFVQLAAADVTLPELERILETLTRLHDAVQR